jgi:hypothetical protein
MDATSAACPEDERPQYTTSKQVQAWFLRRSRDRWKKKYADLKGECKRLKQRAADACRSRTDWRSKAEAACREAQELRAQNAALQTRLETLAEDAQKK